MGNSDWKENAEHLVVDKWDKKGKVTGGQLRMLRFQFRNKGKKNICFDRRENLRRKWP